MSSFIANPLASLFDLPFPQPRLSSGPTASARRPSKLCKHESGCNKYRQGKGFFCIAHGGGRKCEQPLSDGEQCPRSAQGNTAFCLRHNGGSRCRTPACVKAARGATGYCAACGGGFRCHMPGCDKIAQRPSIYCCKHTSCMPGAVLAQQSGSMLAFELPFSSRLTQSSV